MTLSRCDYRAWMALGLMMSVLGGCAEQAVTTPDASASNEAATSQTNGAPPAANGSSANGNGATAEEPPIEFKDEVETNVELPSGLDGLVFIDTDGNRVALEDYLGEKNVVLVFTEGFSGMLCPFCKTQTSRLIANYEQFQALDTEVLVVYPGTRSHLEEFIEAAKTHDKKQVDKVPFPIVLDEEMVAVDFFEIRSKLAHPSTYVIDKEGNVRLAYVGTDMSADRPSIKAILSQLEQANQ